MNLLPMPISDQTSSVGAAFDALADSYDEIWTDSVIGRLQRDQVWREIAAVFQPEDRILELGCGTGIDAVHLAHAGLRVHATDASPEMLRMTQTRIRSLGLSDLVTSELRSIEQLSRIDDPGPFDGVFSDFGAFNCIEDPGTAAADIARLMRPGGKLVLCFMGRFCLWETAWFLLRGCPRKSLRRVSGKAVVETPLQSSPRFRVYYPELSDLAATLQRHFALLSFRGIGVLVPPSCVEKWAEKHRRLLNGMALLDRWAGRLPVLRGTGDHRLAVFERKTE